MKLASPSSIVREVKACPNCRVIYGDDYSGTCTECGAPMGGIRSASVDLAATYARQRRMAEREAGYEQAFRQQRGNARPGDAFDRAAGSLNEAVVDVARRFVVVPEGVDDAA